MQRLRRVGPPEPTNDAEDAALRYWLGPKPKGQAAETGEIDRAEG
jgi:hypothetical protein